MSKHRIASLYASYISYYIDSYYIWTKQLILRQNLLGKYFLLILYCAAVKCNSHPTVIKLLAAIGANFDCASKVINYSISVINFEHNFCSMFEQNKMKYYISYFIKIIKYLMNSYRLKKNFNHINILHSNIKMVYREKSCLSKNMACLEIV